MLNKLNPNPYLKAIFAGVTTFLGSLSTVLVGSSETFSQVTSTQWVTIAIATVGAVGVVWGVPNADPTPPPTPGPPA